MKKSPTKTLIIYCSWKGDILNVGKVDKGNNEFVAEIIENYMKADKFKLEDPTRYPENYEAMKDYANNLKYARKRPKPKKQCPNLDNYDTIFFIYPIWNQDLPMIFYTFLENNEFNNKTIIPLCTQEVDGICQTYEMIRDLLVEAKVIVTEFTLIGKECRTPQAKDKIEKWLKELGY